MRTETMSRILLTVLIAPAVAFSFYWLFGNAPIWGFLVLVAGLAILFWVWKPVLIKKEGS